MYFRKASLLSRSDAHVHTVYTHCMYADHNNSVSHLRMSPSLPPPKK